MKKNSRKTSKITKGFKWSGIRRATDHDTNHEMKVVTAFNYRQKHNIPTRQQEQDFVDNLRPHEKTYAVFDCIPPEKLWNSGDWEGIAYDGWLKRKFRALMRFALDRPYFYSHKYDRHDDSRPN